MRFDIITIFPEIFRGFLEHGVLRRAMDTGLVRVEVHDLRDYTDDRHRQVDDRPFGGGAGMVMMPGPLFRAIESLTHGDEKAPVVLLSPQGRRLNQEVASELSLKERLILICGRYEGIDERVVEELVDDEISIGDYVLSGGEVPAMVVLDAVVRLVPGVLGCEESSRRESFVDGRLDFPQYTRPAVYRGLAVPDVLLSGNHEEIDRWRRQKSLERTIERRPDLIQKDNLSDRELEAQDRLLSPKAQEKIDT